MGLFKRGERWGIRYWINGHEYKELVGRYKRQAVRALERRRTEIEDGKFVEPRRRCKLTFSEFAPRFLEWSAQNKRSTFRDKRLVKNLQAHFGPLNLEKISIAEVEAFKTRRLSGDLRFGKNKICPGVSTVNRELACLRRMLNLAVAWGELRASPLTGKLKLAREPEGRVRYLTPDEAGRLVVACAPHLRPLVLLALNTGMRRGEVVGLRWSEVDLSRAVVSLPGERCKSGKGRTIPLNPDALAVLREAQASRLETCPLVFHRRGQPLGNIRTAWQNACRRAGIEDLHFHDLRHCFASALVMRGAPMLAVKDLLGHASLSQTQRYSHLSPESLRSAAEQASLYLKGNPNLAVVAGGGDSVTTTRNKNRNIEQGADDVTSNIQEVAGGGTGVS